MFETFLRHRDFVLTSLIINIILKNNKCKYFYIIK